MTIKERLSKFFLPFNRVIFVAISLFSSFALLSVLYDCSWLYSLFSLDEGCVAISILTFSIIMIFSLRRKYRLYFLCLASAFDLYFVIMYFDIIKPYFMHISFLLLLVYSTFLIIICIFDVHSGNLTSRQVIRKKTEEVIGCFVVCIIIVLMTTCIPAQMYKKSQTRIVDSKQLTNMFDNIGKYDLLEQSQKEDVINNICEYSRNKLGIRPFKIFFDNDEVSVKRYVVIETDRSIEDIVFSIGLQTYQIYAQDYSKFKSSINDFQYAMINNNKNDNSLNQYQRMVISELLDEPIINESESSESEAESYSIELSEELAILTFLVRLENSI